MVENHSVISLENKMQFVYPVKALVPSVIFTGSRRVANNRVFPCKQEQKKKKNIRKENKDVYEKMKTLPAKQYPKRKRKIQKREKSQTKEQYTSEKQFSCSNESDEWEPVKDDNCTILKNSGKPILKRKVKFV